MAKSLDISPARLAAFEILRRVEDGAFASILLASKQHELKPSDRALTHELVLGVLRRQLFLDRLITHFSSRESSILDPPVRIALRIGLYQLRFLSRIPASAAVNESVKLMRFAKVRSAEGLVNAVLRRATREPDYDPTVEIEDPILRMAVEVSHPVWLLQKWIDDFGLEFTRELALANNTAPPITFRVVRSRADEQQVISDLKEAGAELIKSTVSSGGWRFRGPTAKLFELVQQGKVYIQDEASQLVAETCVNLGGRRILDLCAAPGSKTTLIADLSADQFPVAADISKARLVTVTQTAQLHGLNQIQYVVLDGLKQIPFAAATFDTILVDAPCSGSGTLRRNPEIRWRITAADIQELSARQTQLLANAASVLKSSGKIVYSTCSVEPEENEFVVSSFLAEHRGFEQVDVPGNRCLKRDSKALRTWPHLDGCDGFFTTILQRKPIEN